MSTKSKSKQKILIVDDYEINRAILSEMLGNDYDVIEAENGAEAITILQQHSVEISLVLLDIVMPVMDGYEVLALMNSTHLIDEVPVIMISSENSPTYINRAYDLGVMDFISRPFDIHIVRHRVKNIILLYAKKKKLEILVADQIFEKEKSNRLMISILSHIVEFRNGESGLHVLHVQKITEILLNSIVSKTDKYKLSYQDIDIISTASALHDIGKIAIPGEILNKPGRLTPEEFTVMKTHSAIGAQMLDGLEAFKNETLLKFAYEICRWHHERYDGRGYPDGLKGEDIPISAQVVSLADVYDALTSERVYKKAFSHEKAMEMIIGGECGNFNPLLYECLKDCQEVIRSELTLNSPEKQEEKEIKNISKKVSESNELTSSEHIIGMLETARTKNEFTSNNANEIWFEFTKEPSMFAVSQFAAETLDIDRITVSPYGNERIKKVLDEAALMNIKSLLSSATIQNPEVSYNCKIRFKGELRDAVIKCRAMWINKENTGYTGVVGKVELL